MDVEIRTIEAQRIASIRTTTTPATIGPALAEILPEVAHALEENSVTPVGPPFARYHAFSEEEVDLEGGIAVAQPFTGAGRVHGGELPAGRVAVFLHTGPYEKLGDTYAAISAWLEQSGESSDAGAWELYIDDPTEVPAEHLRTEIYVPLA